MAYFEFPHTRSYDGDLGYIIKKLDELTARYDNFFDYNFIRFHDPINWNISTVYPAFNIVYDDQSKALYIAKTAVPAGIDILNTDYWLLVSPFKIDMDFSNTSINPVANKVIYVALSGNAAAITDLNDRLAVEITNRAADITAVNNSISETAGNIEAETEARTDADLIINQRIDEIISGAAADPDAELVDIRVGKNGLEYTSAGAAVRDQSISNIVDLTFETESGYLNTNGTTAPATSDIELITKPIKIKPGQSLRIHGINAYSVSMWVSYGFFTASDSFLGRTVTANTTGSEFDFTITAPDRADYVKISWRSYGTFDVAISSVINLYSTEYSNTVKFDDITDHYKTVEHANLLHYDNASYTQSGLTIGIVNNVISISGTSSARVDIIKSFTAPETGYYWLSGIPAGGGTSKYFATVQGITAYDTGAGKQFYLTKGTNYNILITVTNNETVNLSFTLSLVSRIYSQEERQTAAALNYFKNNKFYDHLFIDTINRSGAAVIPCQSSYHIELSKNAGFDVMELNVLKTSDDKYIVMHGVESSGEMCFGNGFYSLDETDISSTPVNTVTMSYIKSYIRYSTAYDKFDIAPLELSEALKMCVKYGIIPLVYVGDNDSSKIAIIKNICGDNYIAYDGSRALNNSMIMTWASAASGTQALEICHKAGLPAMLCLSNIGSLNDTQIAEIVSACHSEGYQVGFAAAYVTAPKAQHFFDMGCDFAASGWDVNEFAPEFYVSCYADFSDIDTTGTTSNNSLVLSAGDTATLVNAPDSSFVNIEMLEITFTGDIDISFGSHIDDVNFTASTLTTIKLSTLEFNTAPNFTITANDSTTIDKIIFKARRL